MADTKISALTTLTGTTFASDDVFVIVDTSTTTTKGIPALALGLSGSVEFALPPPIVSAPAAVTTGSTNQYYGVRVRQFASQFASGVRYRIGGTSNGTVSAALYTNDGGTQLATKATPTSQGTANNLQSITFDSSTLTGPGDYIALVWFSSATATFFGARYLGGVVNGTQATTAPATVATPATANADYPILTLF